MPRREIKFGVPSLLLLALLIGTAKAALFTGCDYVYNINPGYSYLESPYYPNSYQPWTSCRYKFVAPLDYEIKINCTMNFDKSATSSACSTEFFYVARDGDLQLRGSEQLCGYGNFVRTSVFRSIVLAYESRGSWGSFQCQLLAQPQKCDCGWSVNTKIVNGVEARVNEYPSIVALTDISGRSAPFCAGAIIAHRYILTAAHCTRVYKDASKILALVGQHDLASPNQYAARYAIQNIIEHPYYTSSPVANDLAILRTVANIEWSRGVGPACLPPPNFYNSFDYSFVDVAGWGTLSFGGPTVNRLRKLTLMVQTNKVCQAEYSGTAPITAAQMCTYDSSGQGKDTCQFDSGGPNYLRLSRQFIIGCISFGKVCGQGNTPGYPMGVNTRLTSYLPWIYKTIGSSSCPVAVQ